MCTMTIPAAVSLAAATAAVAIVAAAVGADAGASEVGFDLEFVTPAFLAVLEHSVY